MKIIHDGWTKTNPEMGTCPACFSQEVDVRIKPGTEENPVWEGQCRICSCFYTSEAPEMTFISGMDRAVARTTSGDIVPDGTTVRDTLTNGDPVSKGE